MALSILVAKILAITYIAAGVGAFGGRMSFSKIMEDFERSPALTYLTGFAAIVFGVILVDRHRVWTADWRVFITCIGWASLLKGILLIAFPQYLNSFKGWYKDERPWGILLIVIGLFFGYFGFF